MTQGIKVVKYLPQNHRGNKVSKLLGLADIELQNTSDSAITIGLQAGVDSATYGLTDWEKMLSIDRNPTASLKDRREVVKATIRGHGSATKEMIRNTAEAFGRVRVEIIEHPSEFRFTVHFIGSLDPYDNLDNLFETLNRIKPAHLAIDSKNSIYCHAKGDSVMLMGLAYADIFELDESYHKDFDLVGRYEIGANVGNVQVITTEG